MLSEAIPQASFSTSYVEKALLTWKRQVVSDKSSVAVDEITLFLSSVCVNISKYLVCTLSQ